MAHELDFSTGNAGIAITHDGEVPWHGFGTRVRADGDLDEWRTAAGLDWDVLERPVFYGVQQDGQKKAVTVPDRKALLRSDNDGYLATVGSRYQVVQPSMLVEFYRDLVNSHDFRMDTMGSLKEGRKIWALASIGSSIRIMGQDQVDGYLLMSTSFDGSSATLIKPTSIRVVCNNTLQWALGDGVQQISVPHSTTFDEQSVKAQLGLVQGGWHRFEDEANLLAEYQVEPQQALDFFSEVLGPGAVVKNKDTGKLEFSNALKKIYTLFEAGRGQHLRSAHHTAWGLVNAITEYQDHVVGARSVDNRFDSSSFGAGANRKAVAWDAARELAGITRQAA